MAWKRASNFLPSLWLNPSALERSACKAAIGRYVECILNNYEAKPAKKEGVFNHFYTILATKIGPDTNPPLAQMPTQGADGKTAYEEVPFTPGQLYSLKAPGGLHHTLARYWSEGCMGMPLRITYEGLSDPYSKGGEEVRAHRFSVDFEDTFTPQLVGSSSKPQISHEAEEPYGNE